MCARWKILCLYKKNCSVVFLYCCFHDDEKSISSLCLALLFFYVRARALKHCGIFCRTIFIAAHENKSRNSFVSISYVISRSLKKLFRIEFYRQTKDFSFSCADNYYNFLLYSPTQTAIHSHPYAGSVLLGRITTLMYVVITVILVPREGS